VVVAGPLSRLQSQSAELPVMSGVVEAIQVERSSRRRRPERIEELVDQQFPQALQRRDLDGILEPRQHRLRGGRRERVVVRHAVADQLEYGIVTERVMVVLVLVTGDEAPES
jgi:ABC-type cobalamin/Fe3+-siderophores transport system ATPase subunit